MSAASEQHVQAVAEEAKCESKRARFALEESKGDSEDAIRTAEQGVSANAAAPAPPASALYDHVERFTGIPHWPGGFYIRVSELRHSRAMVIGPFQDENMTTLLPGLTRSVYAYIDGNMAHDFVCRGTMPAEAKEAAFATFEYTVVELYRFFLVRARQRKEQLEAENEQRQAPTETAEAAADAAPEAKRAKKAAKEA